MAEQSTSDNLEQSVDGGIDKALAAKGMYDTVHGIGAAAAAEAGKVAAESTAASGAGASAAAGTGAAVGSAGGPAGTVMGIVTGLALSLFAKPVIKALIVIIIVLVMIFKSLPSMLFEKPVDVADNTGPTEIYTQFKDYAMERYTEELDKRKKEIEDAFQRRAADGEFDDYDNVDFSYSFIPGEEVFIRELQEASTLIIAMFEINTDDWRKAGFSQFKNAVNSVYFWSDTIVVSKDDEESSITYNDEESTLHIHISYNIYDKGVEAFRSKFSLTDEKEFLKSVEMAYNTKIFFGELDGMPMGGISGGGASGSYPGGGTHNTIRTALAALDGEQEFFGENCIVPLPFGTWFTTDEFGPRNFAPDPIHTGLDFAAAQGTEIYSAMDGMILLRLTNMNTFGHHIVVYHGGGITTMYAHLSSFGGYNV